MIWVLGIKLMDRQKVLSSYLLGLYVNISRNSQIIISYPKFQARCHVHQTEARWWGRSTISLTTRRPAPSSSCSSTSSEWRRSRFPIKTNNAIDNLFLSVSESWKWGDWSEGLELSRTLAEASSSWDQSSQVYKRYKCVIGLWQSISNLHSIFQRNRWGEDRERIHSSLVRNQYKLKNKSKSTTCFCLYKSTMDFTEVCLDLNIVQTKILKSKLFILLVRNLKAQIKS